MSLALLRRSLVAATTITMLTIPGVFAETVVADHDLVTAGAQNVIDLGTVEPGADVPIDLYFVLTCSGTSHVDDTQAVRLTPATRNVPSGGGFSVGSLLFGLGGAWPADGAECPAGLPPTVGGPLHMSVTAPTTPGDDYRYFFTWSMGVTPASADDTAVFSGDRPSVTIFLDVPGSDANTPPTLHLPHDSTVEGDTAGGAIAAYSATATDAEDATAPTPSCSPGVGDLLPLGTNTITCSATDGGGLTTTDSFHITVVDTTAPTLTGMPNDVSLLTSNPAGAKLTYAKPGATDIVDSSPDVSCSPSSGSTIPVGDTTVTCTATDASGNTSSRTFAAHVTLAQGIWDEPVGTSAGISVNGARSVPVKVQLLLDGRPVVGGDGALRTVTCDGGTRVMTDDLAIQSNGRWMGHIDTTGLASGCYQVWAVVNGAPIASFQLDVRGGTATATKGAGPKSNGNSAKP